MEEVEGWVFHRTRNRRSPWAGVPGVGYFDEMMETARRIDGLIDRFQPDILHAHSPVLNALPALQIGARRSLPVVYELRALWEDAAVNHGTMREDGVRYRLCRALESYALRHADHITTICEGLRAEIVARDIASEKITVIPNGVDTESFRFGEKVDVDLRQRLGLDDAIVIGFVGSFYGYEGLDLLIKALTLLAPSHRNMRLLLVGGGPQETELKSLARKSAVQDKVVFTGRVPHKDVKQYYDLIDVLVYPRHRMRLTDLVTPLKPLEAMAQGRMVVASDVGGHRELICNGETGFLFTAGDVGSLAKTIEHVLQCQTEWPRLRARARRFVESERSWGRSVGRYAQVYRDLVTKGKRAVPA